MKKIIITSSDSKYFQLLKELISSIQKHNLTNIFDIGVLDTGLNNDQIQYLSKLGVIVTNTEWNIQFSRYKIRGREYLKNIIARAFLPDYFQGYSTYIWIDADTWINDKKTFMLFDEGCKSNSICITPQVDRSYGRLANVEWFLGIPKKISDIQGYTLTYGTICEKKQSIDDVILSVFRSPRSFTGEDVVEISCHGSLYIQNKSFLKIFLKW